MQQNGLDNNCSHVNIELLELVLNGTSLAQTLFYNGRGSYPWACVICLSLGFLVQARRSHWYMNLLYIEKYTYFSFGNFLCIISSSSFSQAKSIEKNIILSFGVFNICFSNFYRLFQLFPEKGSEKGEKVIIYFLQKHFKSFLVFRMSGQ